MLNELIKIRGKAMKIEMNTVYHLPTQAHEDDFLRQAEKQGILWYGRTKATEYRKWSKFKEEHCISVNSGTLDGWCDKPWFESHSSLPIIKWEIERSERLKKVRCIDNNGMSNLENGQIYEVELQYNDWAGKPLYRLKGVAGSKYATRFEDVVELDFKVGDKVVFARETDDNYICYNKNFDSGKAYEVKSNIGTHLLTTNNTNRLLYMPIECFDLAPEPKPIAKEQTTVKKVRCIDALFSQGRLKSSQIYEVTESVTSLGTKYYAVKGVEGTFFQNRFEDVVEEKYPQIEEIFGDTIVFNPPYTIAKLQVKYGLEKGKWFIGKAKCNPNDTYDKWTGFKIAHQRMRESKPCSK